MGQGTESCGGYDVEYDPYDEGLATGHWTMKNGGTIHVSQMAPSHLRNTIALCQRAADRAGFSDERDKWNSWVEVLRDELKSRLQTRPVPVVSPNPLPLKPTRGLLQQMKCHCGRVYSARVADLNRGWGLSCCKSCAAVRRKYGRPAAKPLKI